MKQDSLIKLPRLFVPNDLRQGEAVRLDEAQGHYLRTVMRRENGDYIRLFNGRDGEWQSSLDLQGRKDVLALPEMQIRAQSADSMETHLIFAPLKKESLDFLIQKATELGVTHLHPVITQNTEARRLNEDRARAHIVEAAEQCERLTLPILMPLAGFDGFLTAWPADLPVFAALEREKAATLRDNAERRAAFLVGPEGGFTAVEKAKLAALPFMRPVTLGASILRAETAALFCLAARRLSLDAA